MIEVPPRGGVGLAGILGSALAKDAVGARLRPELAFVLGVPRKLPSAHPAGADQLSCVSRRQPEGTRVDLGRAMRASPSIGKAIAAARLHHGLHPHPADGVQSLPKRRGRNRPNRVSAPATARRSRRCTSGRGAERPRCGTRSQTPLFRRLLVTWRTHLCAHEVLLMKVMRLHRSRRDAEFLYLFRVHMNDLVNVLQNALNE